MSLRRTLSGFRKKAKEKVSNIGNSIKRQCVGDDGLDHSTLSLQSEPAAVVESELRGDTGVGVGNDDPRPDGSLSVSRSVTGLEREPGGSGDYTAQQERGQKGLHPHAYEQAGRGSSKEREDAGRKRADQVDPPPSELDIGRIPTPSILQDGEPEST